MEWDSRFHVSPSKDNQKVHNRFREYFGKPYAMVERLSQKERTNDYIEAPNLISTLDNRNNRFPGKSKAVSRRCKHREEKWNNQFYVSDSLANNDRHSHFKQFFTDTQDGNKIHSKANQGLDRYLRRSHRTPGQRDLEKRWMNRTVTRSFVNEKSHKLKRYYFGPSRHSSFYRYVNPESVE